MNEEEENDKIESLLDEAQKIFMRYGFLQKEEDIEKWRKIVKQHLSKNEKLILK